MCNRYLWRRFCQLVVIFQNVQRVHRTILCLNDNYDVPGGFVFSL